MSVHRTRLAVVLLLLAAFAQIATTIRGTSMTIDEGLHITSGYTILRTGDYRLVEEHPPLVKIWLALPLLAVPDLPDVTQQTAWQTTLDQPVTESLPLLQMTQELLYPYRPFDRLLVPARMMAALLGVLLLAVIARWARAVWSGRAMVWVVALASFDPNLIAHSSVATTDIGSAALILLALLAMVRLFKSRRPGWAIVSGILMGMALTAKLTSVLLAPAFIFIGIRALYRTPASHAARRRARLNTVMLGVLALIAGGITFWAVYGFQIGRIPGISFPVPAAAHAIPVLRLLSHSQEGHQSYLLGMHGTQGWWFYFPVAAVLKTPLPALVAAAGAVVFIAGLRWRKKPGMHAREHTGPLLIFTLTYIAASLISSLNIGYRHLLPILPALYILAGAIASSWPRGILPRWALLLLTGSLLAWQAVGTLRILPFPLGFHNEIAGGPANGWRYLADSNTDWGQGYRRLAEFQDAEGIPAVRLSAFIFYDPGIYGVRYEALPPLGGDTAPILPSRFAPAPGHYAISMTPLDGVPTSDPEMYDWFRWREPDATIGYALRYYHVTAEEVVTSWVAQCTQPLPPLDSGAIEEGLGQQPARTLLFDCTQSWIYPAGDQGSGIYAIHGMLLGDTLRARLHLDVPAIEDPFIRWHLTASRISYRQRAYRDNPAFALYRSGQTAAPPYTEIWTAAAGSQISALYAADLKTAPVDLNGPLRFLGATTYPNSGSSEITTWWEVIEPSDGRPMSLMAHLLDADGAVLSVADGLGVNPVTCESGDIIVQRHRFAGEGEGLLPGAVLRTGAYWLDTGERWLVSPASNTGGDGSDAIFVPISAQED